MPHYADGTPATPGDTVRGKGYNIKDEAGELAEITGLLLHVDPNASMCNVQVAVVELHDLAHDATLAPVDATVIPGHRYARLRVEFGQADHFTKV